MLVPSKTANGEPPVNSGKVDDRICPPGAETSGLSRCSNAVGPPEEKSVMTPLRPVSTRSMAFPIVTFAAPPCEDRYARSCAPSRSVIIPEGSGSWTGIASGPPARLSTMTSPTAPAARARNGLRDEGAVSAGDERDVSGERAWAQKRLGRVVRVGLRAAEPAVDRDTVRPR